MKMDNPPQYQSVSSITRSGRSDDEAQQTSGAVRRFPLTTNRASSSELSPSPNQHISSTPLSSPVSHTSSPASPLPKASLSKASTLRVAAKDNPPSYRSCDISPPGPHQAGEALPDSRRDQGRAGREEDKRRREELHRSSYVSSEEAKQRHAQLRTDARIAAMEMKKSSRLTPYQNSFRELCSTDLLFLIDCTASMRTSIRTVKDNVKKIVIDAHGTFFNEAQIRIGIVAYRDHGEFHPIEALDFTTSVDDVVKFLDDLTAEGGRDVPEDVLGGLRRALDLSWKHQTRCIFHIGDAPPHGQHFHVESYGDDRYPKAGSEPHGLTYEPLLKQMIRMNINYALLPVNWTMDRMALLFAEMYLEASADVQFSPTNRYYVESRRFRQVPRSGISGKTSKGDSNVQGKLGFVVAEPGVHFACLRRIVVKQVLTSASRTASRTLISSGYGKAKSSIQASSLTAIGEDEFEFKDPQWERLAWFKETIAMKGFSPNIIRHNNNTLWKMLQTDEKIKISTTDVTIHKRAKPFAAGAMRLAFHGRTTHSTNPLVIKSSKRSGKSLAHLVEEMRCQTLCKALALEFNNLVKTEHQLDFIVTSCLKAKSGTDEMLSIEPYIHGNYIKYNNNCGWVNENIAKNYTNIAAQAFSHYTFEISQGNFLVNDLQGVYNTLTDPAIHTRDETRFQLTDTNLGLDGFKFFFATHECNEICRALKLKSNKEMLLTGAYRFRMEWPSVGQIACCSNKFCAKLIDLKAARKSADYDDFVWCDMCWPQLEATRATQTCIAPGPHHTFVSSAFFFESQGRLLPKVCATHRAKDESISDPSWKTWISGLFRKLTVGRNA